MLPLRNLLATLELHLFGSYKPCCPKCGEHERFLHRNVGNADWWCCECYDRYDTATYRTAP